MPQQKTADNDWKPATSWVMFIVITIVLILVIHALAFFPHEYAHSFTAWVLGWKANPLALNYGQLNPGNILAQLQIDENVDYAPIFATGHGWQAAIIAAAGMVIGNVFITYPISLWGYFAAKRRGSRGWSLFFYWFCIASVGNFIDYVPIRTFAPHGDMFTVEQGFGYSPWWIMIMPGIPFAIALVHFYIRFMPSALQWLFPNSAARRAIMIFLTTFALFGFYCAAGFSGYGVVSHTMSAVCLYALVPVMTIAGWLLTRRQGRLA